MGWIDKGFSSRRRRLPTNKFHDRCFALKRLLLHVKRGEQPRLKLGKDEVLRQCQQVSNGFASRARKTSVEIAIRRQPQASASAAKGLALIGDDAEGALPWNVEPYRGRVKRRVSPLEFEGFSDQVQQLCIDRKSCAKPWPWLRCPIRISSMKRSSMSRSKQNLRSGSTSSRFTFAFTMLILSLILEPVLLLYLPARSQGHRPSRFV